MKRPTEGWVERFGRSDQPDQGHDQKRDKRARKSAQESDEKPKQADNQPEKVPPSASESEPEHTRQNQPKKAERRADRLAAEQTIRRRVELAELYNQVAPDARGVVLELQAALARHGGDWHLEQGRHVYSRIVREETRIIKQQSVKVAHRFAWRRSKKDREPVIASEELARLIDPELPAEEQLGALQPLAKRLSPKDEVVVRWQRGGQDVLVEINATQIRVRSPKPLVPSGEVTLAEIRESEEVVLFEQASEQTTDSPDLDKPYQTEAEAAPRPKLNREVEAVWLAAQIDVIESEPDSEPQLPESQHEVSLPTEAKEDLVESSEPLLAHASQQIPREQVELTTNTPSESPNPERPESQLKTGGSLKEILEAVSAIGDTAVPLPPIAGGEIDQARPEPSSSRPNRAQTTRPPRPPTRTRPEPARFEQPNVRPDETIAIPPSRAGERTRLHPERIFPAERRPSDKLRRKARKLARILARRYHLRLTPELEAYLVALILRPDVIAGRRVIGLGINREELQRVMSVLWLNFGDLYAIRPSPPPPPKPTVT